jgi:hypothetical protein
MPLRGEFCFKVFEGMRKSTQKGEGANPKIGALTHLLDEFPAGYSLAGCSSAEPASTSPAAMQYAATFTPIEGFSSTLIQRMGIALVSTARGRKPVLYISY